MVKVRARQGFYAFSGPVTILRMKLLRQRGCERLRFECYGKGFDAGPPSGRAGSLSFCWLSRVWAVFLGLSYPLGPI